MRAEPFLSSSFSIHRKRRPRLWFPQMFHFQSWGSSQRYPKMVMLQKFKLMATQCGAPAPSPTASPLIQLRRRKTLRTLLGRTPRRREFPDRQAAAEKKRNKKSKDAGSRSLKELFVSSPPPHEDSKTAAERMNNKSEAFPSATNREDVGGGGGGPGAAPLSPRPVWLGFRQRCIKRAWRPVLVTIPE